MKYKVGDKVRVKSVQTKIRGFGGGMLQYAEQIATITNKYDRGGYNGEGFYRLNIDDGFFDWSEEMLEPAAPTLKEIKEKKLSCVVHTKSKLEVEALIEYIPLKDWRISPVCWWDCYGKETAYNIEDGQVAGFSSVSFYEDHPHYGEIYEFSDLVATDDYYNGFRGDNIPTPEKPVAIEEQLGLPKGVSIRDLPTNEWYNPMRLTFKNGSSIETIPQKGDTVRGKNHFCTGFRGGKKPEYFLNEKDAKEYKKFLDNMTAISELVSNVAGISYEESINKAKAWLSTLLNDGISAKNGGKNTMKFTFYVTEGTRVDKSCNGTIPTMTTMVSYIDKYGCIMKGTATCDKTDYDERQGVLEAFANATCRNDFYKVYAKAVKEKKHRDIADRTCSYCGKVCDTIEDKNEHEAWHIERRKARHERYLLRKRAKEIAFEEQAQKMAKEMMGEQK